jgi:hypothetical protein
LPARHAILDRHLVLERLLVQNFIALPAPLFRRETALEVGGLQEDLWYTADWDFWLKLAAVSRTVYLPMPLTGFRIHARSQTIRRSTQADEFRRQLEVVLEKHLEASDPDDVSEVARFSAQMNVFLAATVHGMASLPA